MHDHQAIQGRYEHVAGVLDERGRRAVAAAEALGWGGITAVSRATGLSRKAIARGIRDVQGSESAPPGRIRRAGGGRKKTIDKDPTVLTDLERLVEPTTRGDPESPLRWTCKSVRRPAGALGQQGHQISHQVVSELLHALGYRLQANRTTREADSHPDRDAQFVHITATAAAFLSAGDPVISVDTKKKEVVGDFTNNGREWRPSGEPEEVRVHDFPLPGLGRISPSGVYHLAENAGWVNVGIDHDTAAFAVERIRRWWQHAGQERSPQTHRLLITV